MKMHPKRYWIQYLIYYDKRSFTGKNQVKEKLTYCTFSLFDLNPKALFHVACLPLSDELKVEIRTETLGTHTFLISVHARL